MLKKLLYITIFISCYYLLANINLKAHECHFYIDDTYINSTKIPFYLYEVTKYDDPSSFPITKYKSKYEHIQTVTMCEEISKEVKENIFSSTRYTYYESITYNDDQSIFYDSKFTQAGTLKAYATIEDRLAPVFKGYKEEYITNIDNPIPIETLLKSITAFDETDGDITNKIQIIYENYTNNIKNIGKYTIILSVSDQLNNKATLTIHIEIKDTNPPTINGKVDYISLLSNPLNISEIKNTIEVKDNYNKNLEKELYICEDNYTQNKNKPGIYHLFFCVSDLSNNISIPFKINIEVIDDIKPIIEGLDYYTSSISSPITIKEIMYSLCASDSNRDISSNIYILEDYYSAYSNTLGEKHIFFEANDAYGNLSIPFKVTINLIDDISPTIFGLNTFTSYLSHPLSTTHIKQQLTALDNIDNDITHLIEIIEDTYSPNINNKGTFYITLQVKDSSNNKSNIFKITIKNIDDVNPYITGKKELEYELKNKPTIQQIILDNYKVIDNIDQNIKIEIKLDSYSQSLTTGTYYVELTCIDSENNNCVPFQSKINIVETITKIKHSYLYLPTSILYNTETIANLINLKQSYILINDTYSDNYYIEGIYSQTYQLLDKSTIEITIQTYSTNNKKQKKETFLSKIKRFFSSIIKFIKNIFNCINYSNSYQEYLQ